MPVVGKVRLRGFADDGPVSRLGGAGWSVHGLGGPTAEEVTRDGRKGITTPRLVVQTGRPLRLRVYGARKVAGQ